MSQSFLQSCSFLKLLLGAGFFLGTAQAQFNFPPATKEACNELNFPCQGGIYCCRRPALCIPYFNQLVCLDLGGLPVDGGTGGVVPVDGQIGGIPGGVDISFPPIVSGDGVGPVVSPTIPPGGGEINFTPTISGGGVGPIVIPTLIGGGGITLTPSLPGGGVGPIVIPTLSPVSSGGNDGFLAGEQIVPTLPPRSTTTTSLSTLTSSVPSSTVPAGGRGSGDNNGFVTPSTPSNTISISILPSFTSVVTGEGGGEAAGGENGSKGNQKHNLGGGGGVGGNNQTIPHGGGSASSGSGLGPGPNGTIIHGNGNGTAPFTGAASSPRSVRGLNVWGGNLGVIIAVGVAIAGVGAMMAD